MNRMYTLLSGVGMTLVSWVLPQLWPAIPLWLAWTFFVVGLMLVVISMRNRAEPHDNGRRNGDIKVNMGNNNSIGQIGHRENGRKN